MLSHHLPQLAAHLATAGRHAVTYCHAGVRALTGALFQLQTPRDAYRVALRHRSFPPDDRLVGRAGRPFLLIHYHIFKNAGTSFEWALCQALGKGFRQYDSPQPHGIISAREIARLVRREPGLRAISSHQASPPPPRILGRKVITSILFRDPIARIGSIYQFERAQGADTPGALKAKELNFRGYVEWRLATSPSALCNYQVSFCSGRRSKVVNKRDLEAAIIRLDALDIVGTVGRYQEWLALAESILRAHSDAITLDSAHRNKSSEKAVESERETLRRLKDGLGPRLASELLERNELDMTLHAVAEALLTRRLAERFVANNLWNAYKRADTAASS